MAKSKEGPIAGNNRARTRNEMKSKSFYLIEKQSTSKL